MRTSLKIDEKSPSPEAANMRPGFLKALKTMITLIEKAKMENFCPHEFRDDFYLWRFFTQENERVSRFFSHMKSAERIAFELSYASGFWDMRVNVKEGKKTIDIIIFHFHAEKGLLTAASDAMPR
ncbi:MAG: hypothetical protein AAB922_02470 [Patescibacteria group bacterium]